MRNISNKDSERDPKPNDSQLMKRPLTLDLNKKIPTHSGGPPILSTPDVNLCKLGSPELENYILNTDTLQTPTPSGIFPTTAKVGNHTTSILCRDSLNFSSSLIVDHHRTRRLRQGI